MPELPEVETTRRGIAAHLEGQVLLGAVVRQPALRWPVPALLSTVLAGQVVLAVERRAKYLLLRFARGTLLMHLGMSGSLRFYDQAPPVRPHDHIDLLLAGGAILRYHDPRRFGCILWTDAPPEQHPLLRHLAPEPLSAEFTPNWLQKKLASTQRPIKVVIMDQSWVVGVGNIYASESLFRAGILPTRPAASLAPEEIVRLHAAIQATLTEAIAAGGTTLRDYVNSEGREGFFQIQCFVYARAGEPCRICATPIQLQKLAGRATYWCNHCQS